MKLKVAILSLSVFAYTGFTAQNIQNNPGSNHGNKFEQLEPFFLRPISTEPLPELPDTVIGKTEPIMTSMLILMKTKKSERF
jgi:hypothetical protein